MFVYITKDIKAYRQCSHAWTTQTGAKFSLSFSNFFFNIFFMGGANQYETCRLAVKRIGPSIFMTRTNSYYIYISQFANWELVVCAFCFPDAGQVHGWLCEYCLVLPQQHLVFSQSCVVFTCQSFITFYCLNPSEVFNHSIWFNDAF